MIVLLFALSFLLRLDLISNEPRRVSFKNVNQETLERVMDQKVLIRIAIKNNSFILPTFFGSIEQIKSKNKIDIKITYENTSAEVRKITNEWKSKAKKMFDSVELFEDERSISKDFEEAISQEYDYIFFITSKIVLVNAQTIDLLINKKKTIVAPVLISFSNGFSNLNTRNQIGCYKTSQLLEEIFLADLQDRDIVDVILANSIRNSHDLSQKAFNHNVLLHICNRENYGYNLVDDRDDHYDQVIYLRHEHLLNNKNKTYNNPLPISQLITNTHTKTKLGFDKIYVINLERRQDRRRRIESALDDMNLEYEIFKAIDAKQLNKSYIKELGISALPGYKDLYKDRPLNYGEIGCFLSHYLIWLNAIENGHEKIMILEDDARFHVKFQKILQKIMSEIDVMKFDWNLIYLGRKIMQPDEEYLIDEFNFNNDHGLIRPSYSHWTVAYALSLDGAKKLVQEEPLKKLVPVDEYLPIMFNKQPNKYWTSFFRNRTLNAFAIHPSIISPTHYYGEPNYLSDTENTQILNAEKLKASISNEHVEL